MATDFTYNNKLINAGGPLKPTGKDMPLDARIRVNTYADIQSIPNPYVGMVITVLQDENNGNVMKDYKVKSLKANSLGVANTVIDEVVPYADYLGVSAGGGSGEGLTSTQLSNIAKIPAIQSTVDALPNNYASKNHNHSEYASKNHNHSGYASSSHRHDASEIDNLPSGGGTGLTSEQAQHLQTAYEHSQTTHVQASDIPSLEGYATETFVTSKIAEASLSGGEVDLSGYATKDDLKTKANTSHTHTTSDVTDLNLSNIDAVSLNGKKFSEPMTKQEYDAIADKEPNTIYLVDDDTAITGVPDYSTNDAGKVLAVNSAGNALAWVNAPTGSGTGLTEEQATNVAKIPTMETKIASNTTAINNRYTKEEVNEIISNISIESGNIKIRDVVNGESFIVGLPIYGDIIVSSENISAEENATTKFTVKLSKKPTNNQIITLSVSNSECSIDKSSLTFTPTNYNQLQEINVTCNHDANSYKDKKSIITLSSLNVDNVTVNVTITNIDEQVFSELVSGAVFDQTNIKGEVNITSTYGFSPEVITNMVNKETSSLDGGSSFTVFAKVGFQQKTGSENPFVGVLVIQDVDKTYAPSVKLERAWNSKLHWAINNNNDNQYLQSNNPTITCENGVDMYITFIYDSTTKKMYIYKDAEVISQQELIALSGFNSENNNAVVAASEISPIRRILIYSKALTKEEVLQNINALGGV